MLFYDQIRQLRKAGTEVSVTVGAGKALADGADPMCGASCQPAGGPGTPANAVPCGTTVLSPVPHAITPAHPEGSPTALVNPGQLPVNVAVASGGVTTLLTDTTLPGANALIDVEPNVEPVVPPAMTNVAIASGGATTSLPDTTLSRASAVIDVEPNVEPVVPPAINAAAIGAIVDDVQPQFASSQSSLSSTANNLNVRKRKRWDS
jgi:hypothetical protein